MNQLYTFVITCCDGTEAISQEYGISVEDALSKWALHIDLDGFIESLNTEERKELAQDFSASIPTIFGITDESKVDNLKGVWVVSTALNSGKHIIVHCIRSSMEDLDVCPSETDLILS